MSFNQFLLALGVTVLTTSIPNALAIYFAIKLALKAERIIITDNQTK